jgi:WD40 repeat protein
VGALAIATTFPAYIIGAAAWSPDSSTLAVGGISGVTSLFDARTDHKLRTLDAALPTVRSLAWGPDGARLAVGGNNQAAIWNTRTGHVLASEAATADLSNGQALLNTVVGMAWSPDGRRLALSGDNARPKIWQPPALVR